MQTVVELSNRDYGRLSDLLYLAHQTPVDQ